MAFSVSGDVNRDVTITFVGRDQASSAMRSISSSASRTTTIAKRLGTALKYVAAAAAAALAAAAVIAARALWDATKAAYYDNIEMEKLARTQRKAQDATRAQTQATAELIDKLELATGIADDEMRPAMAALAGTGMKVTESQELLAIALDVSVARGKSVQTVAEALAKAYNGQLTSLQRLGVKVTDANGETLEFAQVLKQLEERFGGAAKAAGKTDPLKRLEATFNQLKEEIGAEFLPLLRQFTKWMIKEGVPYVKEELVPAIKDFAKWIRENGDTLKTWGRTIQGAWKILEGIGRAIGMVIGLVQKLWRGWKALVGSDTTFLQDVEAGLWALQNPARVIELALARVRLVFTQITTAVRSAISAVFDFIAAAARIPDVNIPLVPGMASGGYLKRRGMGGWTMVGEHGPELINNRGYVKTASQTMGMNGGGIVVNVNVSEAADPLAVGRAVEQSLLRLKRARGGLAFV